MKARNDGKDAEGRAARYLEEKGYRIVARNWRARRGELDLVAMHDGTLCFVEVRQRGGGARVTALESIDRRKQASLVRAAQEYLLRHGLHRQAARFDVIAIDARGELTHLENAFTADVLR